MQGHKATGDIEISALTADPDASLMASKGSFEGHKAP